MNRWARVSALIGNLVDIAANMASHLGINVSEEDRQRIRRLA